MLPAPMPPIDGDNVADGRSERRHPDFLVAHVTRECGGLEDQVHEAGGVGVQLAQGQIVRLSHMQQYDLPQQPGIDEAIAWKRRLCVLGYPVGPLVVSATTKCHWVG